jgi:hypothetical protein
MCANHWAMVPPALRQAILDTVPQISEVPSIEYARNVRAAIDAIIAIEAIEAIEQPHKDQIEGSNNAAN